MLLLCLVTQFVAHFVILVQGHSLGLSLFSSLSLLFWGAGKLSPHSFFCSENAERVLTFVSGFFFFFIYHQVYPWCSLCQNLFSLLRLSHVLLNGYSRFCLSSHHGWVLVLLPASSPVSSVMNTNEQTLLFNSLGIYPEVRIVGKFTFSVLKVAFL